MSTMSKLDAQQIARYSYDADAQATRVTIMPTELSLEGSSEVIVQADGIVDCSGYEYVCLYGTGTVSVSPDTDGATMHALTLTALEPKLICAKTIQIVGSGKIVIQSV